MQTSSTLFWKSQKFISADLSRCLEMKERKNGKRCDQKLPDLLQHKATLDQDYLRCELKVSESSVLEKKCEIEDYLTYN